MLVLSRKRGEKIVLPQCSVAVTVVKIQGQAVRLGISAPPDVAVHRDEVWNKIHGEGFGVEGLDGAENEATLSDGRRQCAGEFAAELADSAYQIALRHGLAGSWLDLELGLWKTLAKTTEAARPAFSVDDPAVTLDAEEMARF